jgi:hypothetical protein
LKLPLNVITDRKELVSKFRDSLKVIEAVYCENGILKRGLLLQVSHLRSIKTSENKAAREIDSLILQTVAYPHLKDIGCSLHYSPV